MFSGFSSLRLLTTTCLLLSSISVDGVLAGNGISGAMHRQKAQLQRMKSFLGARSGENQIERRQNGTHRTFSNPEAQQFHVDGTKIPLVNFDAGDSWSGLIPISNAANETRKLFFWFWPAEDTSSKDLVFWTNGGPGCSSMEGNLQENGPISWGWGQSEPTPNKWAWTKLANVLYVEQPVGTGFSQGKPNITNDFQLAAEVAGFLEQWLNIFSEMKGSTFYVTGESYAGYYVPYIANHIYEHPGQLDLNLKGVWIADPTLSYDVVQEQIPALRFVEANKNVFPFNSTFMKTLHSISDKCGYTDYLEKNLKYPPAGQLPFPAGVKNGTTVTDDCDIFDLIFNAITLINPVFNIYRVTESWPNLWSVLGFPEATQQFIYFNRTDVQDAIHAPHVEWSLCTDTDVYVGGHDLSVPSTLSVLPNVIEKSARSIIVHGRADMVLIAEGTRIAIQNMTWDGKQGFQKPIKEETFHVNDPIGSGVQGVYGAMHQERNLTYVEFDFSGHMTPQFVPWAAYQTIQYLLGKRESPSA